ncbi:hypothetical protein [uncultured Sphingomonas sp.]|uniref:hypothetical protein n=1 Tax=uncultured Sphingomonas sp. TaxID=158754 RepID=UPI0035CC229C
MTIFSRFSPLRAIGDLRRFLASRGKHEVIFLFASFVVVVLIIAGFVADSTPPVPYKRPTIVFVQQWRADRTDAQIVAQQKIDAAKKKIVDAKIAREQAETRAAYKRLNDKLKPWL